jgi:hypothetical protein
MGTSVRCAWLVGLLAPVLAAGCAHNYHGSVWRDDDARRGYWGGGSTEAARPAAALWHRAPERQAEFVTVLQEDELTQSGGAPSLFIPARLPESAGASGPEGPEAGPTGPEGMSPRTVLQLPEAVSSTAPGSAAVPEEADVVLLPPLRPRSASAPGSAAALEDANVLVLPPLRPAGSQGAPEPPAASLGRASVMLTGATWSPAPDAGRADTTYLPAGPDYRLLYPRRPSRLGLDHRQPAPLRPGWW